MLSIFTFSLLLVSVITTVYAIKGRHALYWVAAVCIYIFSFLTGWSIGQLTVGLTFVLLTLAIAYTFRMVKNKGSVIVITAIGIIIGTLMVIFVDDYWLFFPFAIFS